MLKAILLALFIGVCAATPSGATSPLPPAGVKHLEALQALRFLDGAWVGETVVYAMDGKTVNGGWRVSARVGRMDETFLMIALRTGDLVDRFGKPTPSDTFDHKDFEYDSNPRTPPSPIPRRAITSLSLLGYQLDRGYEQISIGDLGRGGFPTTPVSLLSPGVIRWNERAQADGSFYRTTIAVTGEEWVARVEFVAPSGATSLSSLTTMKRVAKAIIWDAPRIANASKIND